MTDFATARRMMVDCQLRPSEVTDPNVITAILEVPRERFVPPALANLAYLDRDVAVDGERVMLKPMVLARLIQALEIGADARVLDVACGTGYATAILARLGHTVVALDDDPPRVKRCGALLGALGAANVSLVCGPLESGWPALAPYDAILVNGAFEVEPRNLFEQLKDGGRLAGILGGAPVGKAMIYRKDRGEIGGRALFDAAAPLLPPFVPAPAFVF